MQSTFGIKPHTLYEYNPKSVANLKYAHIDSSNPYNQAYGQCLMVTIKDPSAPDPNSGHPMIDAYLNLDGRHFMVDTYLIPNPCRRHADENIADIAKFGIMTSDGLRSLYWACYYHAVFEVTEESAKLLTPICDLTEMRWCDREDLGDYDPSDIVVGAHLARELGYSWDFGDVGYDLVKKSAEVVPARRAAQLASRMSRDLADLYPSTWRIRDFEKFVWEHRDDEGVLEVWRCWQNRIAEALDRLDERRADAIPSRQMTLPDLEASPA